MKSRLYVCPRCGKGVKSTNSLTRHVNAYKIPFTLSSRQPFKSAAILENNTINHLNLPSDNNEEGISPRASNHGKEEIRPVGNNDKDNKPANID